ncbi:MAG: NAD(+) diphosphatase [Spirochaetales bacterium]|nr:NAD(+) diphosphatase [Spirochaetales bacterium]
MTIPQPSLSSFVVPADGSFLLMKSVEPVQLYTLGEVDSVFALRLSPQLSDYIYLGQWEHQPLFGLMVPKNETVDPEQFVNLRSLFDSLGNEMFWLLGKGIHLIHWHQNSRYCGRCGNPTEWNPKEGSKTCAACGSSTYPRISPAVITAITRPDPRSPTITQVLLAKHKGRTTKFYGLIAGFMEPGESAEQTVVREIREETGLEVKNIRYIKSQAWPFPENLMLGFTAEYAGGTLVLQEDELEHADWFSRDNLPLLPPNISLSRYLTELVIK